MLVMIIIITNIAIVNITMSAIALQETQKNDTSTIAKFNNDTLMTMEDFTMDHFDLHTNVNVWTQKQFQMTSHVEQFGLSSVMANVHKYTNFKAKYWRVSTLFAMYVPLLDRDNKDAIKVSLALIDNRD